MVSQARATGGQAGHVGLRGRVTQQRLEQDGDQVGCVGEAVRDRAALGHVGEQREGQRVTPAQLEQPRPVLPRDAGPGQAGPRCRSRRGARGDRPRPGAASPGRCATRRRAARGQPAPRRPRPAGTARTPGAASRRWHRAARTRPRAARSRRRTRAGGGTGGAGGLDGLAETVRRRVDLAPVQQDRGPPGGAGAGTASRAAAWSCRCRLGRGRTAPAAARGRPAHGRRPAARIARPTKLCRRAWSMTSPRLVAATSSVSTPGEHKARCQFRSRGQRRAASRGRPQPGGDIGEDLDVILVLEGEGKGERHLVDLAEGGVSPEPFGELRGGPDEIGREQQARWPRVPQPSRRCWSGSSSRSGRPTEPTAGWPRRTTSGGPGPERAAGPGRRTPRSLRCR